MSKFRSIGTALALSCTAATAHAADTPVDLRGQVSAMYSTVFEDSRRGSDRGQGAYLGYIHNTSERWAIEPALIWHNFSADVENGVRRGWREWGGNIDVQYYLSRSQRFSPYLAAGPGVMRLEEKDSNTRSTGVYGTAGIGFISQVTQRIGLRADARYRIADVSGSQPVDRSSFREPIVRVGLVMPLGAAPQPEPEPAPPPPPPRRPAPEPQPDPEPEVIFEFDNNVLFDFDSSTLRSTARESLDRAADKLKRDTTLVKVEVAGHTDDMGPAAYNKGLSQRRAQSVYDYLVDAGVDSDLLTVKGYGEEQPKYPNTTIENRQRNRRVELIVLERSRR